MDLPALHTFSTVWPRAINIPAIDVQVIVSKAPKINADSSPAVIEMLLGADGGHSYRHAQLRGEHHRKCHELAEQPCHAMH